ncbi:binding-protein dependent transport system inner membrane protein, partial [Pseudomonas syringae pv. actinidiae ICMP 18804]
PMRVMCMHVMRNTMIPVVTVLAMELGSTIAYAVVTESIFAWPGAGKLILDSINMLDRPVVVAYLMVVVVIFVVLNLIVDGLYYLLDPRVRIEASR